MPAITATAPGKVILFGEHAVVYGQPAIAVPVFQVHARAIVTARPRYPAGSAWVEAPAIGLDAALDSLPPQDPLAAAIQQVYTALAITRPPAYHLRVTSSIPVAAGLGSGAAVSVAVVRALSAFLGRPLPLERVSELAYEVEKLHHGTPSGIDNTVIAFGRPVNFTREPDGNRIESLRVARPLTLVIADTGIPSPTGVAVGDVRHAWQAERERFERLFAAIGAVVRSARQAIESGEVELLGTLMNQNHALLCELGVSSPELERLVNAARLAGATGAKLSGGGRGGNLIALVEPVSGPDIATKLLAAGAKNTIVTEVSERGAR
jgi:mevalonate kinase